MEKLVEGVPSRDVIYQRFDEHAGTGEHQSPVYDLRVP
jgi:hypothetical protein